MKLGYKNIAKQYKVDKEHYICFRKLILDFMYDMVHSRLFENSPCYFEIETALRKNFLFNAIISKASYYYDRELYSKNQHDIHANGLYLFKLVNSEKQWINILRSEKSCNAFWRSKGWFKNVEDEFKNTMFSRDWDRSQWSQDYRKAIKKNGTKMDQLKNETEKQYNQDNEQILRVVGEWFMERYSVWNAFQVIFITIPFERWVIASLFLIFFQ